MAYLKDSKNMTKKITFISLLLLSALCCAQATASPQVDAKQQWLDYFTLSSTLKKVDQKALAKELPSGRKASKPVAAKNFGFDPEMTVSDFKSDAGRRIADIVLSFQTPSGGWSKRTDMGLRPRRAGEAWGPEKGYQPTFDNYATSTQLRVLAKAYMATAEQAYADGFHRGLALILKAQMPNGGWPQSFPLDGGYHNHITYNDKAMVNILELLLAVAQGEFAWLDAQIQRDAQAALLKGVNCILMTQFNVDGRFLGWGAQHDEFSLQPAPARAYEMAALSSQESAEVLMFLMQLPEAPDVVVQAVDDAMAWLASVRITGMQYDRERGALVADTKAKPLWARFYALDDGQPVFGDRDGKVYRHVEQISLERRQGYAWYSTGSNKVFKRYEQWKKLYKEGRKTDQ